ncbi:hypothetical protein [Castellaniella sp.]|uniref:cysteine dioxygenase family protein n=1 Tax=Castellaniella sp. TaxID=1955812 RepID=UPI002AFE41C8|nr:hypothetical protein [Castellaniella sp.]
MNLAAQRAELIAQSVGEVRKILETGGVSRASLDMVKPLLEDLARRKELWMTAEFPAPELPELTAFYLLHQDSMTGCSLYLNIMRPGEQTPVHNHTTWACIASVEGIETNYLYRRMDSGDEAGKARLELSGVVEVGPGNGIGILPDDIHAVGNIGTDVVRHLHLYGQDVKELTHRLMFDLERHTYQTMPLIQVDERHELENRT